MLCDISIINEGHTALYSFALWACGPPHGERSAQRFADDLDRKNERPLRRPETVPTEQHLR
jgi:hypothetical protein